MTQSFEKNPNETDRLAELLEARGATITKEERVENTYIAKFNFDGGVTTLRLIIENYRGPDLVITSMTTLPEGMTGKGFGSKAIDTIKIWAKENNLKIIMATQVQQQSEVFWMKNGFVKNAEPNPCNDFIYEEASDSPLPTR